MDGNGDEECKYLMSEREGRREREGELMIHYIYKVLFIQAGSNR